MKLVQALGAEDAATVSAKRGGTRIYIPPQASANPGGGRNAFKRLEQDFGARIALRLVQHFGGGFIYVPVANPLAPGQAKASIAALDKTGKSAPSIARMVGCSESAVHRYRAKKRAERGARSPSRNAPNGQEATEMTSGARIVLDRKDFPTLTIVSISTGVAMSDSLSHLHEAMAHILGHPVWTHEIPQLLDRAQRLLIAQVPDLPTDGRDHERVAKMALAHYGPTISIVEGTDKRTKSPQETASEIAQLSGAKVITAIVDDITDA